MEHVKRAGERVTSFRLSDLTNGQMEYVQRGPLTSVLSLQAWDREEYSNAITLRYVQRGPLTTMLSLQAWGGEEYSNTVTLR